MPNRVIDSCFIIPVIIFILSCVKNIIIVNIMYVLLIKLNNIKVNYRKKVIIFACLSDIIAFLSVLIINLFELDLYDMSVVFYALIKTIAISPFEYKLIGLLFAMLCLFLLNYFITFRNASIEGVDISKKHKLLMSIIITALTSPYFIFIDVAAIISDFNL